MRGSSVLAYPKIPLAPGAFRNMEGNIGILGGQLLAERTVLLHRMATM